MIPCIFRIPSQVENPGAAWSFTLKPEGPAFTLTVMRKDKAGWNSFFLELRNLKGDSQLLKIPSSTEQSLHHFICPWIDIGSPEIARDQWTIPPNIFQTWKEGEMTEEMLTAQNTFKSQKGYSYTFMNDQECHKFLLNEFGQDYANAYALLVPGAYRADFWRYCIIYKYGGVYADVKTTLFRDLDEILRPQDELVLVRDVPGHCLLNGFMACRPGHPVIKGAIDLCLERISRRDYGTSPLDLTGPHILARAFCRWRGVPDDKLTLQAGTSDNVQILRRSEDRAYIISAEGDVIMQKEYPTYYNKDVDVMYHYPQLWNAKYVYADQLPRQ